MTLRQALIDRQIELVIRDAQMAAMLGIPRTTYSSIKSGKNRPSLQVVRRIVVVFPDLTDLALAEDEPRERPPSDRRQRDVDRERRAAAAEEETPSPTQTLIG